MGRTLLVLFRWGIFLLACAFLYAQLKGPKGMVGLHAFRDLLVIPQWWYALSALLVLMLVNWTLEAAKWRWLMAPVERVTLWSALVATIAGTSIALVTPNRTGEFLGRVLFLAPENRYRGGFATALGSIAQFVVTLIMGGLALLVMVFVDGPLPFITGGVLIALGSLTTLVAAGALFLYMVPGLLRQLLLLLPFLHRLERPSSVLNGFQRHELLGVLGLSVLRYVVFSGQFIWLLQLFPCSVSIAQAMLAVPVIYLISTLVPTVLLTELGVRGSAAVAVLAPYGAMAECVLLATFTLWFVNLVLPAMVGSVILLFARIRMRAE